MRRLLIVVGLFAASAALAQNRERLKPTVGYRSNDAEVLRPPLPPPPHDLVAAQAFHAAYAHAREPLIMVFWNREFSQEVASTYRAGLHAEAGSEYTGTARTDQVQQWDGSTTTAEASGNLRSSLDMSVGLDRVDHDHKALTDETVDLAVEAAFSETLAANGARLIDRNLAMRTSRDARGVGSTPNIQAIETEAVTGRADLLIEVQQSSNSNNVGSTVFKVTVKDVHSARLLAIFASSGHQAAIKPQLVAGPGGFVRAEATLGTSPGQAGHELANEVMIALARSLR